MDGFTQQDRAMLLRVLELLEVGGAKPGAAAGAQESSSGGMTFPNYGRSKNQAVRGAPLETLEYYAAGCRRTLGDASKSRWHDKERALLAAIETEMSRQRGGLSEMPAPQAWGRDEDVPF
jgi:hypothetical protein